MGYFFIKPGTILDVERSQERSHLLALNIPSSLSNTAIESGLRKLYSKASKVNIVRDSSSFCSAVLAFPSHSSALNAKRWSGIGSINLWNRNIKILWAPPEQVEQLLAPSDEVKHVLLHNMPEDFDPDDLGQTMEDYIKSYEIVSIRPMNKDWMIEFTTTKAAYTMFSAFENAVIGGREIFTEWVTHERMKSIDDFVDFDFELRNLCLANYFDPPIFIYGRIIPFTKTQIVAVIIKNNRINNFTTFFIEINYEDLIELHARICEALVLVLMELRDLPKKNTVIKCTNQFAFIGNNPQLELI